MKHSCVYFFCAKSRSYTTKRTSRSYGTKMKREEDLLSPRPHKQHSKNAYSLKGTEVVIHPISAELRSDISY